MEILAFSGTWPPLNGVRGSVPGLGTRSHFRTLIAQKSASGSSPATNGAAFTVATGWIVAGVRSVLRATIRLIEQDVRSPGGAWLIASSSRLYVRTTITRQFHLVRRNLKKRSNPIRWCSTVIRAIRTGLHPARKSPGFISTSRRTEICTAHRRVAWEQLTN